LYRGADGQVKELLITSKGKNRPAKFAHSFGTKRRRSMLKKIKICQE
jgi:hypothetical protein